jgi:hypothetical protein
MRKTFARSESFQSLPQSGASQKHPSHVAAPQNVGRRHVTVSYSLVPFNHGSETMQNRGIAVFILLLSFCSFSLSAKAQSSKDIVGSWSFLINETTNADGTKVNTYGIKPKGILMFDSGGHFSLFIANPHRPKFASGSRLQGTSEEYKGAVQGSISYFGKYTIDETAKVINFELEASSFPNWDGVVQKRPFSIRVTKCGLPTRQAPAAAVYSSC